jgi:CheY-like chemotaxis protein
MALLLKLDGYDVKLAHDGPEAIAVAREFKPALVLLDIGLPSLSGYEVAHRMRADPSLRESVLVAMTGYGQPEDRVRTRAAGFDHHLTKPVDETLLTQLLEALPLVH